MDTEPVRIDFLAGEGHFADHLAPIFRALPDHHRGTFYARPGAADHVAALGLDPVVVEDLAGIDGGPVVVAAIGDRRRTPHRPVILAEHGAGQSYSNRHPSYAGGIGRDGCALFIVPNAYAARRNRARYPAIPNAIVGCPKLDRWAGAVATPSGPVLAVVSFHWRCKVAPETNTALDHFAPALEATRLALAAVGVELAAHAHPRIMREARPIYEAAGLEVLDHFEDVLDRAHVYAVDNSSTLFEFAATGRPVAVLNSPRYRRGVRHGLRFWTEADVGVNVDTPAGLPAGLLRALEDPAGVARSREGAVARVYPVRDGTSSARAAKAILDVTARTCAVCGTPNHACGEKTDVIGVDQRMRSASMNAGPKKRYKNPNGPGFIRLSDERARRMGLLPSLDAPAPAPDGIVSSGQVAVPSGALSPGGPTARARARATTAEEPDDGKTREADGDKKRDAPATPSPGTSGRRRRAAGAK